MNTPEKKFRIHTNGKLRSHFWPGGQGGLFYEWIALTRYSDAAPFACGPMLYIREGDSWKLSGEFAAGGELIVSIDAGIAPGADAEIRRIQLTHNGKVAREIELTTCAEIALNHPMGDAGHPAFSKLFVQTSVTDGEPVLLARRRPRGLNENWPWIAQALVGDGADLSWETNRATFIGRGHDLLSPAAMEKAGPLSGETGNVLDPVMAWRTKLSLAAGETKVLWLITAVGSDEAAATATIAKCREPQAAKELLDETARAVAKRLEESSIREEDAPRYDHMAAAMLSGQRNRAVPSSLEGADIVHRYPLSWEEIRVIAKEGLEASSTKDVIKALPYWNSLGLQVRLFVMDAATAAAGSAPEGVTIVDPKSLSPGELTWWLASAQLVAGESTREPLPPPRRPAPLKKSEAVAGREALQCSNGHGGFSADGSEYVIPLPLENGTLPLPPMPWVNVLANPEFGCIVTEKGAGYTWSRNSQANRLTPWSNDPIRDPHGEAFYVRDDDSGKTWSPLPGPAPARCAYTVRHGFGRSRFLSTFDGLKQSVEVIVPPEDPVKLVSIILTNDTGIPQNLSFFSYHQLLLCSAPDRHQAVLAWTDPEGVSRASNPRAGDFSGGRVFSIAVAHGVSSVASTSAHSSGKFIGDGGMDAPSGLALRGKWTDEPGFGRDACFAKKLSFKLDPGRKVEIVVVIGEVMSEAEEKTLVARYSAPGAFAKASEAVTAHWDDMLNRVQISTPLPEVDLMVNGWLTYQNLACRIWGRSAFYQSGGAYGFRDQLQDSGALAAMHPELMRSQILLHAAQQFPEGDVTHWWHPDPMNRGMRTNFSDDLLWLPYLTDHYLQTTGDETVLQESLPFIEGPLLGPDEDEEYMKPEISKRGATVFEHCCLAIDKSLTRGEHGLPLMGIGDWNDGMSRIGREGRGESVWMGFFLYTILERWIPLCETHGEAERAAIYKDYRDELLRAINDAGWDGEWYRRAYYDDGTPLGTHTDTECRIDALAQAWAIISEAAPADRAKLSLDSLERELVNPEIGLIHLLYPPFVNTPHDPGYIKGYVAGVRENGGQYTHAACWVIRAMAEAGRRDRAAEYLRHLSPIWHSRDAASVALYKVEPYVVAADIYGAVPHVGRGGWTWYTGSAGWMFRVAVESVLGLRLEKGDTLVLSPRVPDGWPGFSIRYRTVSGKTLYQILVSVESGRADQVTAVKVDGKAVPVKDGTARWGIQDDGATHTVDVILGA